MVELVAALALFVIILGLLLTVLDSATNLWSSARSQQREQLVADTVAGILAADLCEAVTDNGTPTNSTVVKPTFYLQTPASNAAPGEVTIVPGFVRTASPCTSATGIDASVRLCSTPSSTRSTTTPCSAMCCRCRTPLRLPNRSRWASCSTPRARPSTTAPACTATCSPRTGTPATASPPNGPAPARGAPERVTATLPASYADGAGLREHHGVSPEGLCPARQHRPGLLPLQPRRTGPPTSRSATTPPTRRPKEAAARPAGLQEIHLPDERRVKTMKPVGLTPPAPRGAAPPCSSRSAS